MPALDGPVPEPALVPEVFEPEPEPVPAAPPTELELAAGSELHAAHTKTSAQSLARGIGQFAMFPQIRARSSFCNTDLENI
ncbi:MAG TPA: hypothetical protein VHM25_26550 [Polyangiaceae bacterium]|nr:hypothetical protein [Polyangiaceae bacterium]